MGQYLVELFVPRTEALAVLAGLRRAEARAPVRLLRSIFVPEDEICFLLFEAACEQDVRDAGLPFERISEALTWAEAPPASIYTGSKALMRP